MTVWALFRRFLRLYSPFAKRRYRKCLANIARLERELWPRYDPECLPFGPGAVIPVKAGNYVQFYRGHNVHQQVQMEVLKMRNEFTKELLYGSRRPQEAS